MSIQNAPSEDSDQLAQAGVNLRWEHMSESTFSDVAVGSCCNVRKRTFGMFRSAYEFAQPEQNLYWEYFGKPRFQNFFMRTTRLRSDSLSLPLSVCLSVSLCLCLLVALRTRIIFYPTKKHAKTNTQGYTIKLYHFLGQFSRRH